MPQKHPRNEPVTSAEELGTMSKNNLRRITLGIRPIWLGDLLSYPASTLGKTYFKYCNILQFRKIVTSCLMALGSGRVLDVACVLITK